MRPVWPALFVFAVSLAGCMDSGPERDPLTDAEGRPLGERLRLEEVVSGLQRPVFVVERPGASGELWVLEQTGTVRVVADDALREGFALDLRAEVESDGFEQGLLGFAFHPDFPDDARVFVHYTAVPDGRSVLASLLFDAGTGRIAADSEVRLLEVAQPYENHNGGMVAFGPDGMLYWALGDGGAGGDPHGHAQDVDSLLGKILRLDVTASGAYAAPEDNPFVGGAGRDEVWVYGLRNPWRFSFDRATGDLWIGDVGQNAWEEVDLLPAGAQAGANLGWDAYEGSHPFEAREVGDVVMPVAEYPLAGDHAAVVGGYRYRGAEVGALQGIYLFSDWGSGWLWGLEERGDTWHMGRVMTTGRSVSSFGEGQDGTLYVLDHGGSLLRLVGA